MRIAGLSSPKMKKIQMSEHMVEMLPAKYVIDLFRDIVAQFRVKEELVAQS